VIDILIGRCHECDAAAIKCGMFFNCMHSVFKNQTCACLPRQQGPALTVPLCSQREDFLSSAEVTNFVVYATIEVLHLPFPSLPLTHTYSAGVALRRFANDCADGRARPAVRRWSACHYWVPGRCCHRALKHCIRRRKKQLPGNSGVEVHS
jgi:hypothetical protein